jgi:hypothetical protein
MADREEAQKAWIECHSKYQAHVDAFRRIVTTERATTMTKHKTELVLAELQSMSENTPTYKAVGRA